MHPLSFPGGRSRRRCSIPAATTTTKTGAGWNPGPIWQSGRQPGRGLPSTCPGLAPSQRHVPGLQCSSNRTTTLLLLGHSAFALVRRMLWEVGALRSPSQLAQRLFFSRRPTPDCTVAPTEKGVVPELGARASAVHVRPLGELPLALVRTPDRISGEGVEVYRSLRGRLPGLHEDIHGAEVRGAARTSLCALP